MDDSLRFYPYRTTFDFESFFDVNNLPDDSDRVQWVTRHVPLSVSVASNVPGYYAPRYFVTDGDSDEVVADMMTHLVAVSDAAFDLLLPSYDELLKQLKLGKEAWDEPEEDAEEDDDGRNKIN